MEKTSIFRARCTLMEGWCIDPNLVEIYNVDDPTEIYFTGHNQFRIGQRLTTEEFYLQPEQYGDETWMVAYRRP